MTHMRALLIGHLEHVERSFASREHPKHSLSELAIEQEKTKRMKDM